jgi:hypothetical protein
MLNLRLSLWHNIRCGLIDLLSPSVSEEPVDFTAMLALTNCRAAHPRRQYLQGYIFLCGFDVFIKILYSSMNIRNVITGTTEITAEN